MENLEKYVSIVPTANQKAIEEMGFYVFAHFGMNTFTGLEWGDGKADPALFNPTNLDCNQWCSVIKKLGAKGIIATAKHHDGFCLWQTDTTDYCVKASPFRGGKGDVIQELSEACAKSGLKLGIYLSPWDRHSEYYGTEKYNDFYCDQMTELLTRYGDIFTIWLDGACGSFMDGKPMQKYDFARYYALARKLQPNCAISNCGPDVRWVGNEGGQCRQSEWNVVPRFGFDVQAVMSNSQQTDAGKFEGKIDCISEDLGSREVLKHFDEFIWYPAEVDVSVRPGWFFHENQNKKIKSVDKLLDIYYNSVGGNCMLLLNIPPDKSGQINQADVTVLQALGARIDSAFATKIDAKASETVIEEKLENGEKLITYTTKYTFAAAKIDKAVIIEDIDFSQRVEEFELGTIVNGAYKTLRAGTVIGHKKIALFDEITTDNLIFTIKRCRLEPHIRSFEIYLSDGQQPQHSPFAKARKAITKFFSKISYRIYVSNANKQRAKKEKLAEKTASSANEKK